MKYWSVVICFVFSTPLCAQKTVVPVKTEKQELATSELKISIPELRKMQVKLQDYKYLSLNFEQTIYKKLRNKTLKNKGEVYFKKPSSFHWKFSHDEQEEWIYDGATLLHYFPKQSYAYRYKAQASKGKNLREIVNIVLDFDSLLNRYTVESSSREMNEVFLELKPKETGEITKVQLTLDIKMNYMREVKLNFEGGNHSTFVFSNPRYIEIKDSFSLSPKIKITDPI